MCCGTLVYGIFYNLGIHGINLSNALCAKFGGITCGLVLYGSIVVEYYTCTVGILTIAQCDVHLQSVGVYGHLTYPWTGSFAILGGLTASYLAFGFVVHLVFVIGPGVAVIH